MFVLYRAIACSVLVFISAYLHAQSLVKGKIIDETTKEPIPGATIQCTDEACTCRCASDGLGTFSLACKGCTTIAVTATGYAAYRFATEAAPGIIGLLPAPSLLQEIVLSANRGEGARRSEAPVAIAVLSSQTLQETKPVTADQVLNKISGVNMVSLGNEQHQMSIRQPMTTKSLFLYLEDGIPIRTTGLFNHNALLEMNMAATKSIEVIKGPSSSLYGSEAIGGVVNFLTLAPTSVPVLKLSLQGNNIGYGRTDLQSSFSSGKWGFALSGYYARKRNGFMEYTDFHKGTVTARADYRFNDRTNLVNSLTWTDYNSDMRSGVDSAMFASRTFFNPQTFTYRKVAALRYRSTLTHAWSGQSKTTASLLYRGNTIGQNPAYRVRDDYRRVNGVFTGDKEKAHGEINSSSFTSYALIAQHRQLLAWKKTEVIGGISVDISPSSYVADYIRIKKDTASGKYTGYDKRDSVLTNYTTRINNYAAFASFAFSPLERLRVVASFRYDFFRYRFDNALLPSSFSGSPDTTNLFGRLSPKVGVTYNFSPRVGVYANYSQGFVPPQVTEMYTGVQVPSLQPSLFDNYEAGGWVAIIQNKLAADLSVYRLSGTNEVVSVRLDDGSFANQNAGRTNHKGIELGINGTPFPDLTVRFSGAYNEHRFVEFVERGVKYNGNEMHNAPRWMYNSELWYKPSFAKGLRMGAEIQHIGSYFADPQNTATYGGHTVLNLRAGYLFRGVDAWLQVLNATNRYYSYITTKSSFGYSYQLADPRTLVFGLSYDFTNLKKNN